MSFIYEMLETFYFPDEKVKEIYSKYLIEKVYMYHVLTDTDSTCLQFFFISNLKRDKSEQKYREIIAEVLVTSKIFKYLKPKKKKKKNKSTKKLKKAFLE